MIKNNLIIEKDNLLLFIFAFVLILISGLRPVGIDNDSDVYAALLNLDLSKMNLIDKEPAFWLIVRLNQIIFSSNPTTFFLIFALIGVTTKVVAIKRLSLYPFFSVIVYICLYFVLHEMTQIRVGVASGIFLLAIPDIQNKKIGNYLLKVFIACMFHYIAVLMIPIYFLDTRKNYLKNYLLLPILSIVLIAIGFKINMLLNLIIPFLPEFLSYKLNLYIDLLNTDKYNEINIFNIYYSSLLIIYFIIIFNYNKFNKLYDSLFIKVFCLMLFSFYLLSSIPVLAFRVSEFFGVILIFLIPRFVFVFKQKGIVTISAILWLSTYLIFTVSKDLVI